MSILLYTVAKLCHDFVMVRYHSHDKTKGKERATPTQLIKTVEARHLVGAGCSRVDGPPL